MVFFDEAFNLFGGFCLGASCFGLQNAGVFACVWAMTCSISFMKSSLDVSGSGSGFGCGAG